MTHRVLKSRKSKKGVIYICNHETMCPPGYHHHGFVATHALGHMICVYIYIALVFLLLNLNRHMSSSFSDKSIPFPPELQMNYKSVFLRTSHKYSLVKNNEKYRPQVSTYKHFR